MGVDDDYSSSAQRVATKKADEAESESTRRIQAAQTRTHQTEVEEEQRLAEIRDEFQKQYTSEESRQEALLEAQQLKGYEHLRDLQRKVNEELTRIRREGDFRVGNLRNYYRDTAYSAEQKGLQDVKEIESKNQQGIDYTRKSGVENYNALNEEFAQNTLALTRQYENRQNEQRTIQDQELERQQEQGRIKNELAETKHQELYKELSEHHQNQINHLEALAQRELESIRLETADKLTSYQSRQSDPFYKMMDLRAEFSESDDGFTLKLRVPEYEQKNLSVNVKGDNIVVMGQRRNEEVIDRGDGVTQGTSSFQSFHQSFPLSWPVDPQRLSKEMNGDEVIIRVPKKNQYATKIEKNTHSQPLGRKAQYPRSIDEFFLDKQAQSPTRIRISKSSKGSGTLA
jgi:HSP20 family molecular chaperone IbpA